jgi:protein TonB
MFALRSTTSLSALALVLGIASTSWLTALTYERAPMTRRLAEVTLPTAAPALLSRTVSRVAPSRATEASSRITSTVVDARSRGAAVRATGVRTASTRTGEVAEPPAPEALVPVYMPSPRYPMSALRAQREGKVVLSVTVTPEGDVTSVTIGRSSGDNDLDRAAEDAVRGWRFAAADNRPSRYTADLPINFELTRPY